MSRLLKIVGIVGIGIIVLNFVLLVLAKISWIFFWIIIIAFFIIIKLMQKYSK